MYNQRACNVTAYHSFTRRSNAYSYGVGYDTVYDLGRLIPRDSLWFRRFIPTTALMPPPCAASIACPVAHEARRIRQERANHTQRRRLLRRRFVQELAT